MSRANHTQVKVEKITKVMEKAGLVAKGNKGFTKWHVPGQGIKRALGVPTTKLVTRVEIVGFTSTEEGVVAHPKPPAATVEQMVDFARDEKLILRTLWKLASGLVAASQPQAEEAPAEQAPASEPASEPEGEQAEQAASEQAAS